jgi:predicted transcriptional regulator
VLNTLCDEIKPAMKRHKVDRCVLDALVRQLEGFHKSSVILTIEQLAAKSGVSNSSVSGALRRLEAAQLITRRRKFLRERGRFLWELSLNEQYRVVQSPEATRPAPRAALVSPSSPQPQPTAEFSGPAAPLEPERPAPVPSQSVRPPTRESSRGRHRPKIRPVHPNPKTNGGSESRPAPPRAELTEEQKKLVERLRAVRIDYHMACKLARQHDPLLIDQVLGNLRHRIGQVRNPAAWIVRELERGGYQRPNPAQDEVRQAERQVQAQRERDREEQERTQVESAHEDLLQQFASWPAERRAELERTVRAALRRVSPRLAEAPWDLETPGPVRSQLLALLVELPADSA